MKPEPKCINKIFFQGGFSTNEIPDGCVEKEVNYEEIIYDEVMQCRKIVEKKCYQVQETTFTAIKVSMLLVVEVVVVYYI